TTVLSDPAAVFSMRPVLGLSIVSTTRSLVRSSRNTARISSLPIVHVRASGSDETNAPAARVVARVWSPDIDGAIRPRCSEDGAPAPDTVTRRNAVHGSTRRSRPHAPSVHD